MASKLIKSNFGRRMNFGLIYICYFRMNIGLGLNMWLKAKDEILKQAYNSPYYGRRAFSGPPKFA